MARSRETAVVLHVVEGADRGGDSDGGSATQGRDIIRHSPIAAYREGDPKFWGVRRVRLQIDWEDNTACEPVTGGAKASGVKVSRTNLLALLPQEPREREEARGAAPLVRANKAAPTERKAKARPDQARARRAILQLYPKDRYPGGVPDTVSPGTLQRAVADKLAEDMPKLRLPAPSVRTVQRARHSL